MDGVPGRLPVLELPADPRPPPPPPRLGGVRFFWEERGLKKKEMKTCKKQIELQNGTDAETQ